MYGKTGIFRFTLIFSVFILVSLAGAFEQHSAPMPSGSSDARPPVLWAIHSIGNLNSALCNIGMWGDPFANYVSMEWPSGTNNNYLWCGDAWSACYGDITPNSVTSKFASCSDYGQWELRPSEGYPMEYLLPGTVAPEQSQYGMDDWDPENNDNPYGLGFWVENYTWDTPGFDNFIAMKMIVTHHSSNGNPGVPLDALLLAIQGDCDVATSAGTECHLDDLVYYDGHAIWCNDPDAVFEYVFDGSVNASTQDEYTYQQNPDNPLAPSDPENIFYHYNYTGADGIPDNDVDQNGVSDHFTILAKVIGTDTLYRQDPESGVILFSEGMPYYHLEQIVGDTTFLVVPRNLSYMWDSDFPGSSADDTGEPTITPAANGFIGWRLLDFYIVKANGTIERPVDVYNYPIPLSHCWWNWNSDPGIDQETYNYQWGQNPDINGRHSGPLYLSDWVGNEYAPLAFTPENSGPFPVVHDNPKTLGYPVFDYRFLLTAGPVNLEDGDSLHVTGGWVIGLGLAGLRQGSDDMLDAFYRDGGWGVPSLPPTPILFYAAGDGKVELEWGSNAESYFPMGGYRIYRASFEPSGWNLIASVAPGVLSYTDNTAINGYPYYYVVCSYDSETDVESTKSNYKQTIDGTPIPVVPVGGPSANWIENITVVPNPYRGSAPWEQTYLDKIAFTNLPAMCNIHIYTLAGDHVITLEHRSLSGDEGTTFWDLVSRNDQEVTSGLYIYRVETENDYAIGKFAIIK